MTQQGLRGVAAAAALAVSALTGAAYGQALPGALGSVPITFVPPEDSPQGGQGVLYVRQYSADGNLVCCSAANYNARRPEAAMRLMVPGAPLTELTPYLARPFVNIREGGTCCDGRFGQNNPRVRINEQSRPGAQGDDYATLTQGHINIPAAGDYTFGVNSDDSFLLTFPKLDGNGQMTTTSGAHAVSATNNATMVNFNGTANGAFGVGAGRGSADSWGVVNFPAAGVYRFVLVHEEGTGGDNLELIGATGNQLSNLTVRTNPAFNLVGGPATTAVAENRQARKLVTVGPWDFVRFNNVTGGTNNIRALWNNNMPAGVDGVNYFRSSQTVLNFQDPQGINNGGHTPTANMPSDNASIDDNNYGAFAQATWTVGAGDLGRYTFAIYTDDGYFFRILDPNGNPLEVKATANATATDDTNFDGFPDAIAHNTTCCADRFGQWDVETAGTYTLQAAFHEIGGGSGFFLYGTIGAYTGFNAAYQLAGQNLNDTILIDEAVAARGAGLALVAGGPNIWQGTSNANWEPTANWSHVLQPTATSDVVLPAQIPPSGATITLTAGRTAKSVEFRGNYTLTGSDLAVSGPVRIANGVTATINTQATVNSVQPAVGAGSTGGTLAISAGARVTIRTKASGGTDSTVSALQIAGAPGAWTGRLDLGDNAVRINDPAALNTVADQVKGGFSNGTWTGNGITSGSLATEWAANNRSRAIGYAGDATGVTAKLTFNGDTNLDNAVNVADLGNLATNYGQSGQTAAWPKGDFNHDGAIDVSDLGIMATYYGLGAGEGPSLTFAQALAAYPELAAAAVPEPAGLGLLALGGLGLLRRRRRIA